MSIHQTIKDQITEAMRAKDQLKLDTLRGLSAFAQNEMLTGAYSGGVLPDPAMLALIKRSVKQRKDSIEQFEKGGRADLADKEKAELKILETYLPPAATRDAIKRIAEAKIETMKAQGPIDQKAKGKLMGMIMKEFPGTADSADVKAVLDELIK
jgi:uncharacterized protein YqeY